TRLMRRLPPLLFLLFAAVGCTPVGTTQVDRDLSRSIESGQLSEDKLAAAYVDRGTLRLLNDDIDGGIADYDAAIAAVPGYAAAGPADARRPRLRRRLYVARTGAGCQGRRPEGDGRFRPRPRPRSTGLASLWRPRLAAGSHRPARPRAPRSRPRDRARRRP